MRIVILASLGALLFVGEARAFHFHNQFHSAADGREEVPGSGFLYYTGSPRDWGLRCSACHVEAPQDIGADVTFSPMLSGGSYVPSTDYVVTIRMTGERFGLSGCPVEGGNVTPNRNAVVATFSAADGAPRGQLSNDDGNRNCGSNIVDGCGTSTLVMGDCNGVVGTQCGLTSRDTWTFRWRAPGSGSGTVRFDFGIVDGNCRFDSYDDDVFEDTITIGEGAMSACVDRRLHRPSRRAPHLWALPYRRRIV